jgi:hypothetical protein
MADERGRNENLRSEDDVGLQASVLADDHHHA